MRIFVTGDTHNTINIGKLNTTRFPEQKELSKNDVVIIAGDFGFPWTYGESPTDRYWLNWLEKKNFTTVFCDGNHENFEALKTYPEVIFKGARCHQIRPSIYHVMRGEVIDLDGLKIGFLGGAISVDKIYRKEGVSWWPDEEIKYKELEHAVINFNKQVVDIIITHEAPSFIAFKLFTRTEDFCKIALANLYQSLDKKPVEWYFGHHHSEASMVYDNTRFICRYNTITEINKEN